MSRKFLVVMTDRAWPDADVERALLSQIGADLIEADGPAELLRLAADADAIATCWAPVGADVLDATRHCRIVSRFGIGLDNINIDAATRRGIFVTNVPDYCVDEVSEHTLALVLACARKIAFYNGRIHRGEYNLQAGPPLRRLRGQTLGLVGFGRIARAVREKALAFGMAVVATSASGHDYGTGCPMVALDELLAMSNFVSLHVPLTDDTRNLIDNDALAQMKPEAYLINTSRGGLVDPDALADAVSTGRIAGAALDAFSPEPPDLSHPLFQSEPVICTPHAAFLSVESLHDLRTRATQQIVAALQGLQPANLVNSPTNQA